MQLRVSVLLVSLIAPLPLRGELDAQIRDQVAAARSILDSWHEDGPEKGERKLHLVYWTPSDREPAGGSRLRLTRIMEHIRDFYADEMERLGFGPRTINLDYDDEGELVFHLVKGRGPYADYNVQSGAKIRYECLPVLRAAGLDPERETLLIFCNMAEWDAGGLIFKHRSPYYARGSQREGTAWQLDSPELDILNLAKKEPLIQDGQYGRISLGKHNSIFIGGIAHELGHALGLPHNMERRDERETFGTALMGSGNRTYGDELRGEGKGSFLTLAHGLRLASHPQFSGSVKGMNSPARMMMSDFSAEVEGDELVFRGRVEGTPPVYAMIGYCDTEGGGDYNATTATAIPDAEGRFILRCRSLAPGKAGTLRLVACHANGAASTFTGTNSRFSFPYRVAADGSIDASAMQQRFALRPVVAALKQRDWDSAASALEVLGDPDAGGEDSRTQRIGRNLVAALKGEREVKPPADQRKAGAIPLSTCLPVESSVGWGRAAYDHTPDDGLVISAGGRLWEHGIYAHAPARHRYELDGGWHTLRGSCGLADGHPGSVVFTIQADGREVFRSRPMKGGSVADYEIELKDVKVLDLWVGDGGDGTGGDWGMWLEPVLKRDKDPTED